jgi:hypothetical protein
MATRHGKFLLPLLALALGACESSSDLTGGSDARLTVQLTDAPGDLKEAQVKISKIILQGTLAGDSSSSRQEFAVSNAGYINLLTLAGGNFTNLVSNVTVKPGTYTQLRLVVDEAYVVTNDNRVFATSNAQLPSNVKATGELKCPGCSQSGFKVNFPGGIEVNQSSNVLLIDFDVKQSFGHEAGKSGKFIFKPVLHGVRKASKDESLGRISGTVSLAQGVTLPSCGGSAVTLAKFIPSATTGTTVRTGETEAANGQFNFRVSNLPAGSYTLGASPTVFSNGDTLTFTATATPATLTLASGENRTGVSYSVTAATCTPKS